MFIIHFIYIFNLIAFLDNFMTDSAISKYNGQIGEKQLQPWEFPNNGDSSGWVELETSSTSVIII